MKIGIVFLDYSRHDFTKEALKSISLAGYPFDLFNINQKGIAKAINIGIDLTLSYDAMVVCGNDITMPNDWLLKMVDTASAIDNTGMCGIHCVEGAGQYQEINGKRIMVNYTAFGNVLIPRKAIDKIGYFNESYDPYGMQDSDYAHRLNKSGFINYYLCDELSSHIGHDFGQDSPYRKMKDEGLSTSGEKWQYWLNHYEETKNYFLPKNQTI